MRCSIGSRSPRRRKRCGRWPAGALTRRGQDSRHRQPRRQSRPVPQARPAPDLRPHTANGAGGGIPRHPHRVGEWLVSEAGVEPISHHRHPPRACPSRRLAGRRTGGVRGSWRILSPAWTDRSIRWTTTLSVVVFAGIAAVLSYKHMFILVRRYGETSWTSTLLPVSVDGMIADSSMTLLADSRNGQRSGLLPWSLLVIGSAASLVANVAVAEPSAVGRQIAAWPSCALIGSYELLMRQVRHAAARKAPLAAQMPDMSPASDGVGSYVPHTRLAGDDAGSYRTHTSAAEPITASHDDQTGNAGVLVQDIDEINPHGNGRSRRHGQPTQVQTCPR